jgi:hypothetical protein
VSRTEALAFFILVFLPVLAFWIAAVVHILTRRRDLSAKRKVLWIAGFFVAPTIALLAYLAFRPSRPRGRASGGEGSPARSALDEIAGLSTRHAAGEMSDEEYTRRTSEVFGLA